MPEVVSLGALLLRRTQPLEQVLHSLHAAGHAPAGEAGHRLPNRRPENHRTRAERLIGLEASGRVPSQR
jgi:hypothetical protein